MVEQPIIESLPHGNDGVQAETALKAMRGYVFGRKRGLIAAE